MTYLNNMIFITVFIIMYTIMVNNKVNFFIRNLQPEYSKFKNIIILAKGRDGSTLISKLLSTHDAYLIGEPINSLQGYSINQKINASVRVVQDMLQCMFKHYIRRRELPMPSLYNSPIMQSLCNTNDRWNLCSLSEEGSIEEYVYGKSKYVVIKTLLLSFQNAIQVMKNIKSKTAILHVIRDPRAILASRIAFDSIYKELNISTDATTLCQEIRTYLEFAENFKELCPRSYFQVKHEELVYHPTKTMRSLYEFLGREYSIRADELVKSLLYLKPEKSSVFNLVSTSRDSKAVPNAWRKQLSFEFVTEVQRSCNDILKKMNYGFVHSQADLLNKSVVLY